MQKYSTGSEVLVVDTPYPQNQPNGTISKVLEYKSWEEGEPVYVLEGDWTFYENELDFPQTINPQ